MRGSRSRTASAHAALFGLLGDDHFTIKVSPDGAAFYTGLVLGEPLLKNP